MNKLLLVPALLVSFLASVSAFAVDGLAVIDMRTAVLATQVSKATSPRQFHHSGSLRETW